MELDPPPGPYAQLIQLLALGLWLLAFGIGLTVLLGNHLLALMGQFGHRHVYSGSPLFE